MNDENVFHLVHTAVRGKVRCKETGVVFPQLFRVTGYAYKFKEGRSFVHDMIESCDDLEPNREKPIVPYFTLNCDEAMACAEAKWESIDYLDPEVDTGLVYIRHHATSKEMEAYLDAIDDTEDYAIASRWSSYQTEFGCFTLLRRHAHENALVTSALVYITKVQDRVIGGLIDWYTVIGPRGEEFTIEDLLPRDVVDQYEPILNHVNEPK
jgi:hypothetical protein